ncbi:MAG: flagellar export chaperone FliS [Bdellovibrionales bacterium]|nr:flagellar export chaperone FliS [Bdellovibrionales bacterium]
MSYGAKSYKQTAIKTATPEQVLLMLYEGAIKAAKLAKTHIEKPNVAEKCKQITKVHDIVVELNTSLDHSKSPEVATQLASLYEFCTTQLLKANMNNDTAALDSVIKILTTLYEGWVAAVEEVRKAKQQMGKT